MKGLSSLEAKTWPSGQIIVQGPVLKGLAMQGRGRNRAMPGMDGRFWGAMAVKVVRGVRLAFAADTPTGESLVQGERHRGPGVQLGGIEQGHAAVLGFDQQADFGTAEDDRLSAAGRERFDDGLVGRA